MAAKERNLFKPELSQQGTPPEDIYGRRSKYAFLGWILQELRLDDKEAFLDAQEATENFEMRERRAEERRYKEALRNGTGASVLGQIQAAQEGRAERYFASIITQKRKQNVDRVLLTRLALFSFFPCPAEDLLPIPVQAAFARLRNGSPELRGAIECKLAWEQSKADDVFHHMLNDDIWKLGWEKSKQAGKISSVLGFDDWKTAWEKLKASGLVPTVPGFGVWPALNFHTVAEDAWKRRDMKSTIGTLRPSAHWIGLGEAYIDDFESDAEHYVTHALMTCAASQVPAEKNMGLDWATLLDWPTLAIDIVRLFEATTKTVTQQYILWDDPEVDHLLELLDTRLYDPPHPTDTYTPENMETYRPFLLWHDPVLDMDGTLLLGEWVPPGGYY